MDRSVVLTRHDPDQKRFRSGPGGLSPASRRLPASEKTFAEENYYRKQMQNHTAMVVRLAGGEEMRGSIDWYDRDCVKLNRVDGPNVLLMKRYIVCMHKAEEEKPRKRKQA
jgi:sRNA-binding regulator protein Hfq